MKKLIALIALCLSCLLPALAWAGSGANAPRQLPPRSVAEYSDRLQHDLAARGAQVAIVSRVGRPPSDLPEGIRYTHVAYWVYSNIQRSDGTTYKGYRVYNLYQTAENDRVSALVQDSPAEFFAGAYRLDAGVIIPDPRLQKKLLTTISSPVYRALHRPRYSVLANPVDLTFQNCTEHTLDVLMASLYDTTDRRQIKANISAHFDGQPVQLGTLKRLFAPLASATYNTSDHDHQVETATFSSIARFMAQHDLSDQIYRFTKAGPRPF